MQAQLEAERLEQRAQEERYENMAAEAEEKSRKLESAPGNPTLACPDSASTSLELRQGDSR